MKIVVKQIDELKGNFKDKVVEEFMVYLIDQTGRPLSVNIEYGKAAKNDRITYLIEKHFDAFNDNIEIDEVSYDEFLKTV